MPDLDTQTTLCTFCPNLCRHACPVETAEPREAFTPRAKMATLGRLRRGTEPFTVDNAAALYACSGCGACTEVCKHKVEPASALVAGRAAAFDQSAAPAALADLPARVREKAEAAARAMREGLPTSRFPSEARVAFLPGCDDPGEAAVAVALLSRLGADYLAVADVTLACGGAPLLAAGAIDAFRQHAVELAGQIQGYARLVVGCPACAHALRNDYAAHGVKVVPEIVHVPELLAPLAWQLPVTRRQPAAHYHDPCFLGRRSGVYEAPRRLLERALEALHEFPRRRQEAACSGGGGVLPLSMSEVAEAMADARIEELRDAGGHRIVTACPTCARRLTRGGVTATSLLRTLEEATRPA